MPSLGSANQMVSLVTAGTQHTCHIFVDGSNEPKPSRASVGWVVMNGEGVIVLKGASRVSVSSAIQPEAIECLEWIKSYINASAGKGRCAYRLLNNSQSD